MSGRGPVTPAETGATLAPDAAELATLRELRAVVGHFASEWEELFTSLPDDYDCYMNCAEANAVIELYQAIGNDEAAKAILREHARHDEEGDQHWEHNREATR